MILNVTSRHLNHKLPVSTKHLALSNTLNADLCKGCVPILPFCLRQEFISVSLFFSLLFSYSISWRSCFPLKSALCGRVHLFALQLKLSLSVTFIVQFKTLICNRIQMSSHVYRVQPIGLKFLTFLNMELVFSRLACSLAN